jgi:hypothetical protein
MSDIPKMTPQQRAEFNALVRKCQAYYAAQEKSRKTAAGRPPAVERRSKMAKAITQEAVDKAVAKAVAAETKRCIAAVKGVEVAELKPKQVVGAAVAAIKEVSAA